MSNITQGQKLKLQKTLHEIKYLLTEILIPSAMTPLFSKIYWDNIEVFLKPYYYPHLKPVKTPFDNQSFYNEFAEKHNKKNDEKWKSIESFIEITNKYCSQNMFYLSEEKFCKAWGRKYDENINALKEIINLKKHIDTNSYCTSSVNSKIQKSFNFFQRIVDKKAQTKELPEHIEAVKSQNIDGKPVGILEDIKDGYFHYLLKKIAGTWNEIISTSLVEIFILRLLGSQTQPDEYFKNLENYVFLFCQFFEKENFICDMQKFRKSFLLMLTDYVRKNLIEPINKTKKKKKDANLISIPTDPEEVLRLVIDIYEEMPQKSNQTENDIHYIDVQENRYANQLLSFMQKAARQSTAVEENNKMDDETAFYMSGVSYIHALLLLVYMVEFIRYVRNYDSLFQYWKTLDFQSLHQKYSCQTDKEKEIRSVPKTNAG